MIVTIGTIAQQVLRRNPGRLTTTLRNISVGGQVIYIVLNDEKGMDILQPDYVLSVNEEKTFIFDFDGEDMRNPISAIASAAGAQLIVAETNISGRI